MERVDLIGLMGEGKTEDLPEALRYLPFHLGSNQALSSFTARARARARSRAWSRDGGGANSSSGSNNTGSKGNPHEDGDDSSSDRDSDCNSSNRTISSGSKRKGRQLTFFYQGKVYVYDHVSSAQARAIVASMSEPIGLVNPSADLAAPILVKANIPDRLPLARKASLARFLAKRNERVKNLRLSRALLESKNNMEGCHNAAFDPIGAASKRQCKGNPDS